MKTLAALTLLASLATAAEFPVIHRHTRGDKPGRLSIEDTGISYTEKEHNYRWSWNDIQKLTLEPQRLEIITYKDVKWLAGKDRSFVFFGDNLDTTYAVFREHLPRRFVPEIALNTPEAATTIPAKRIEGRSGFEGTLKITPDRLVFQSENTRGSHTWNLDEVENISSSDPLELTIASLNTDYRLQLKQPLPEGVYNALWRKLNTRKGN